MNRRTHPCLVAFLLCAGTSLLSAQARSLTDVAAGARVRLTVQDSLRQQPIIPARQVMVGEFVRASADSVWLRPVGSGEVGVAREFIRGAAISRGASRWRSALTFGAGFGVLVALSVWSDQVDRNVDHRARNVWIGAGVGLGIGTIIGAISPYEHWRGIRR